MSRMQLWLLVAVAVVLAAFVSGVVRGVTDTAPFEVAPSVTPQP